MIYEIPLDTEKLIFPDVKYANEEGLLAYGGDLTPQRLMFAYKNGIFPWYSDPPILWWSPNPRFVIFLDKFRISKSLQKVIKKQDYVVKFNHNFKQVVTECSRVGDRAIKGTWINKDMIEAYTKLHDLGYAYSVEVYRNNLLCGGLYGVSYGRIFSGESMFTLSSNCGKIALFYLVEYLQRKNYLLIDCQQESQHMLRFGGEKICREQFFQILNN